MMKNAKPADLPRLLTPAAAASAAFLIHQTVAPQIYLDSIS